MGDTLAVAGLIWDIGGAAFLARSLFWIDDRRAMLETAAGFGYNPYRLRVMAEQRHDARFGVVFLIIGFSLQAAGAAGVPSHESLPVIAAFALTFASHYAIRSRTYSAALRTMVMCKDAMSPEEAWRAVYPDLTDRQWDGLKARSGIEFWPKLAERP